MSCERQRIPDFFVGSDGLLRTVHRRQKQPEMTREQYLSRIFPNEAHEGDRSQPRVEVQVLKRSVVVDLSNTPVGKLGRVVESAHEPIRMVVGGLD